MQLSRIIEILDANSEVIDHHRWGLAHLFTGDAITAAAEQILSEMQSHSSNQPPLPQAAVSGNEVAVCPRCSAEHSETDCHGYCTAACMQEDEGQTDR